MPLDAPTNHPHPWPFPGAEFWHLTAIEQAEFEDARDFFEERAAILEYEAGYTREEAEREAERLTIERCPPSTESRNAIRCRAATLARLLGREDWNPAALSDHQLAKLHVNPDYWLSLAAWLNNEHATV